MSNDVSICLPCGMKLGLGLMYAIKGRLTTRAVSFGQAEASWLGSHLQVSLSGWNKSFVILILN